MFELALYICLVNLNELFLIFFVTKYKWQGYYLHEILGYAEFVFLQVINFYALKEVLQNL